MKCTRMGLWISSFLHPSSLVLGIYYEICLNSRVYEQSTLRAAEDFRLTVLDPRATRSGTAASQRAGARRKRTIPPINFHAFAAGTPGSLSPSTRAAHIAENTPVLLLLRGDFGASDSARQHDLKKQWPLHSSPLLV